MTTRIDRIRIGTVARRALAGAALAALVAAGLGGALPDAATPVAAGQVDRNACDLLVSCVGKGMYDSDGDEISDVDEIDGGLTGYVTDPNDEDTDNDQMYDGEEPLTYGTDPINPDMDGDGLSDGWEVFWYYTDPKNWDTDGDGWGDYTEITPSDPYGANCDQSDPLDPASTPQCSY